VPPPRPAASSAADSEPQGTLARANALAAERNWTPEETTYDDEPADEPRRKGRSPWTWPLIALILLLLFALAGFLVSQLGLFSPSGNPSSSATATSAPATSASPTRTTTSATPTETRSTPTPTSTPTPETVNVIPEAYLGKDYRTVQSQLSALNLDVSVQPQVDANSAPNTVIALSRSGRMEVGSPITVTYAVAPPAPTTNAPTSAPTTPSAAAPTAGSSLPACGNNQLPGLPPTCQP
jgi:cytoskeletal protein RodZ